MPALAWAKNVGLAARCIGAIRAAMAKFPAGPVLLNSYVVQPGVSDFDLTQANAAYVYDNALAGLALLAAGHADEAKRIGDALALAQSADRYFKDGRLRNAYQAGPMTAPAKLPGWWDAGAKNWVEDPYQAGSQSGPLAWAMLLWAALGMTKPANLAGDWLDDTLRAPMGYYGGFYGFEPKPLKLLWQSTEQNIDLTVAFAKLGRADDASHARDLEQTMFDARRGVYNAGLAPDGVINPILAADAGIWPYLAGLDAAPSATRAIAALDQGGGIGFSQASKGVWLEGTAFAALALDRQKDARAANFFKTIAQQISPGGYVYASVGAELATGLTVGPSLVPGQPAQNFEYYRRGALSATAWAALAALGANPLAMTG